MRVDYTAEMLTAQFAALARQLEADHPLIAVRYVHLGSKTLRVCVRAAEFLPQMEKQLAWTLCEAADRYDATLEVWKESKPEWLLPKFEPVDFAARARMRVESLCFQHGRPNVEVFGQWEDAWQPALLMRPRDGILEGFDFKTQTYYYAARELAPEELIKDGHLFVQIFNRFVKTPTAGLVHGACVGANGNGVLLCGVGHRGKSTLTVLAMLRGMEYVSDDYQILEREAGGLFAYPIYSIITLSPTMYNEMYGEFNGKFVSMNARKDKYVFEISPYHGQFRDRYPIKACVFPEIVDDPKPSIAPCSPADRSRAIAQLVGSTVRQMRDSADSRTIKKLTDMIRAFPFYKIRLCRDIARNVECLKDFCHHELN